jgi:hypothetical protein
VFDPGLEHVRAGFLVSRYGFQFRAIEGNRPPDAQKQAALGFPRAGCGTYSRPRPRVKARQPEKRPNISYFGLF